MDQTVFSLLKKRVLILDGATGTFFQSLKLTEKDYSGSLGLTSRQYGNNDILSLTRPDLVLALHEAFLKAGADIVETNTLNANKISQAEYSAEDLVYEMNREAARLARQAANAFSTPDKPRFVAGSIGSTTKMASVSNDYLDPCSRAVSFSELVAGYTDQIKGLIDGGADLFIVETIYDGLNMKAALAAICDYQKEAGRQTPVMLSAAINPISGRLLSGIHIDALFRGLPECGILSVGINCSGSADLLAPTLTALAAQVPYNISFYPNAGIPDAEGRFHDTPGKMAAVMRELAENGMLNIAGGCCGTTAAHIAAIADAAQNTAPRAQPSVISRTKQIPLNAVYADMSGDEEDIVESACTLIEDGADAVIYDLNAKSIDPLRLSRYITSSPTVARTFVVVVGNTSQLLTSAENLAGAPLLIPNNITDEDFIKGAARLQSFVGLKLTASSGASSEADEIIAKYRSAGISSERIIFVLPAGAHETAQSLSVRFPASCIMFL